MKKLNQWLDLYAESHQNPRNKILHHFCVPIIMATVLALVWSIPGPRLGPVMIRPYSLLALGALWFYNSLGREPLLIMGSILVVFPFLVSPWTIHPLFFPVTIGLFIASWIGQFIGHNIEGKKPSFLADLSFLLIGPLWVLVDLKVLKTGKDP